MTCTNIHAMMALASLVPSGDCYGLCLMRRQKFSEAKPVFGQVVEWKRWLSFQREDIERSSHLLGKATECGARKPMPKYHMTKEYHALRLRDFLDRWFSTTVVRSAITAS